MRWLRRFVLPHWPAILFALLSIGVALFLARSRREAATSAHSNRSSSRITPELAAQIKALEAKEN